MFPIFDFTIGHHFLDLLFFFIYGARYSRRELYFVYVIFPTGLKFVFVVPLVLAMKPKLVLVLLVVAKAVKWVVAKEPVLE
jgi:hypothetical protein